MTLEEELNAKNEFLNFNCLRTIEVEEFKTFSGVAEGKLQLGLKVMKELGHALV